MYLSIIFLTIVFQFSSSAIVEHRRSWRNDSIDTFVDKIIYNVKNKAQGLPVDAIPLVNTTEEIDKSSWVRRLFTNFTLYNGTLYNLTTIDRYGDSYVSYKDKNLQLNLGINFKKLEVIYNFEAEGYYNFLSQRALIKAVIEDLNVVAIANLNTESFSIKLDGNFPDPGPLSVQMEASTFSSYIINGILEIGTSWFEGKILNAVRESVLKILNDILNGNTK